jgi:beta-galactosidase
MLLTYDKKSFYLDGEPFRLIAGDIHYYRIHPKDWERHLDLAVDFGLNTVQTYVPWNAHEPKPGEYDFSGMLDLAAYLKLCDSKGLKVLLRPAPFICSEWELGGQPAWLLKDRDMSLRSSYPGYVEALERYYNRLIPEFLPFLSTKGGPIIAVAVENEYGGFGNDHKYIDGIADMLRRGGVDVPLFTTDGDPDHMLTFGRQSGDALFGVNFRATQGRTAEAKKMYLKYCKDQPFFVGEFWAGRAMHWGESFYHRPPEDTAIAFKEALEQDAHLVFYMFSGGTNFGFMSGANYDVSYSPRPNTPKRYIPLLTSYDVDALVNESGNPTLKYFLCRDVLDEFLGKPKRPHVYNVKPTQAFDVEITETADVFENIEALTETKVNTHTPKTMELYDQNYGMILYSTTLDAFEDAPFPLYPPKYLDRANLYVDGDWFATFLRDRGTTKTAEGVGLDAVGMPLLRQNGAVRKIDALVENVARVNHRSPMNYERKGLEDCLLYAGVKLFNYETRTLPLNDLSRLAWEKKRHTDHKPCFFKGSFDASTDADTYVCFEGFGHGYVWINGFNLGRYDGAAGPQLTLYLPKHFLKAEGNEIIILDIDPVGEKKSIAFLDHEILEGESEELT